MIEDLVVVLPNQAYAYIDVNYTLLNFLARVSQLPSAIGDNVVAASR